MPTITDNVLDQIRSDKVFSLLSPADLARVAQVNKLFSQEAQTDKLWRAFLVDNVPFDLFPNQTSHQIFLNNPKYRKPEYLQVDAKGRAYAAVEQDIMNKIHLFRTQLASKKAKELEKLIITFKEEIIKNHINLDTLIEFAKKLDKKPLAELVNIYLKHRRTFRKIGITLESLLNSATEVGIRPIAEYMHSLRISKQLILDNLLKPIIIYSLILRNMAVSTWINLLCEIDRESRKGDVKIGDLLKLLTTEHPADIESFLTPFLRKEAGSGNKLLLAAEKNAHIVSLLFKVYIRIKLNTLLNNGFITPKLLNKFDGYIGNSNLLRFIKLFKKAAPLFAKKVITPDKLASIGDVLTMPPFKALLTLLLTHSDIFEHNQQATEGLINFVLVNKPEEIKDLADFIAKHKDFFANNTVNAKAFFAFFTCFNAANGEIDFDQLIENLKILEKFGLSHHHCLRLIKIKAGGMPLQQFEKLITGLRQACIIWEKGILDIGKYINKIIQSSKSEILGKYNFKAMLEATHNLPKIIVFIEADKLSIKDLRKIIYNRSALYCEYFITALIAAQDTILANHLPIQTLLDWKDEFTLSDIAKIFTNATPLFEAGLMSSKTLTQLTKKYYPQKTQKLVDQILAVSASLQKLPDESRLALQKYIVNNIEKFDLKKSTNLLAAIAQAVPLLKSSRVTHTELLQYAAYHSEKQLLQTITLLVNQHRLRQIVNNSTIPLDELSQSIPAELNDLLFLARNKHPEYLRSELTFAELTNKIAAKKPTKWYFFSNKQTSPVIAQPEKSRSTMAHLAKNNRM